MNTEGLSEVAVKDAHPVVEQVAQTPPELEPAPPAVVAEAPAPAPVAVVTNLDDSSLYIHRELSQLQFNIRVLEQALDESYPLLERLGSVQWPCNALAPEGTAVLHRDTFTRGRGMFNNTRYVPTTEQASARYPLILTTGRILPHYNVGTQTRRSANVAWAGHDQLHIHPLDAASRGIGTGDRVELASRSGHTSLSARVTEHVPPGVVYASFHFPDSHTNLLTTGNSDWATNCPEFKVTAVEVSREAGSAAPAD